jgi:hypothetical protein
MKVMMRAVKSAMFAALVGGLLAVCTAGAGAQTARPQFLYVNDDPGFLPNTVEGFSVDTTTGVLTPLPGSPFPTCSNGCTNNLGRGAGYYIAPRITIRATHPGTSTQLPVRDQRRQQHVLDFEPQCGDGDTSRKDFRAFYGSRNVG